LHNSRLFFWAIIGTLCSSALSFLVFASRVSFLPRSIGMPVLLQGPVLRRPSHYMNLEKVLRTSNRTFPPITNFPRVVFQIDPADSQRRMTEDDQGWISNIGAVYPDDRHITISSKVHFIPPGNQTPLLTSYKLQNSTILHFRHLDFAMEECMLMFVLPQRSDSFNPNAELTVPSMVDVWILDSSSEISRHIYSTWKFAPTRLRKLTTLEFSEHNPSSSGNFSCPTNEFTTFELACSPVTPSCNVDFWQNHEATPRGGLFWLISMILTEKLIIRHHRAICNAAFHRSERLHSTRQVIAGIDNVYNQNYVFLSIMHRLLFFPTTTYTGGQRQSQTKSRPM
jgi:hypothetical protein